MADLDDIVRERLAVLLEEWKALAAYIDQGFRTLEKQSVYVVIILAAAVGVSKNEVPVPDEVWLFAPFAVLILLFRLSSQITFAFFQATRLLEIEKAVNCLLKSLGNEDSSHGATEFLWYGHTVQRFARKLRKRGAYSYILWLWLQELLGLAVVAYATYRGSGGGETASALPASLVPVFVSVIMLISGVWVYQLVQLTLEYQKTFAQEP